GLCATGCTDAVVSRRRDGRQRGAYGGGRESGRGDAGEVHADTVARSAIAHQGANRRPCVGFPPDRLLGRGGLPARVGLVDRLLGGRVPLGGALAARRAGPGRRVGELVLERAQGGLSLLDLALEVRGTPDR